MFGTELAYGATPPVQMCGTELAYAPTRTKQQLRQRRPEKPRCVYRASTCYGRVAYRASIGSVGQYWHSVGCNRPPRAHTELAYGAMGRAVLG
eukprot:2672440-Rhodomonas_salina.1